MPLVMGYMLYVDTKPTTVGKSLEEAQRAADSYIRNRRALRIESFVAPAPTQVWIYDYDVQAWVEQR